MLKFIKAYGDIVLVFSLVGLLQFVLPIAFLIHVVIFSIYTMAFSFLMGRFGMVSFGQPAYLGIGAYATGLYLFYFGTSPYLGLLAGLVVGVIFSMLIGAVFVKLSSSYFTLANLALAAITFFVFQRALMSITRGDTGLWYLSRMSQAGPINFRDPDQMFIFTLAVAVLVWALMKYIDQSVYGATCLAVKVNETKLMFLGYNTFRIKWFGFVLGNSIAAFAGSLYAIYLGFVSPALVDVINAPEVVVVALVGGAGTLYGPLIGAIFYIAMEDIVSVVFAYWELVVGALLIIVMYGGERGIMALLESAFKFVWRKRKLPVNN
jgi:branched-chain amino acid transport system permease protein